LTNNLIYHCVEKTKVGNKVEKTWWDKISDRKWKFLDPWVWPDGCSSLLLIFVSPMRDWKS